MTKVSKVSAPGTPLVLEGEAIIQGASSGIKDAREALRRADRQRDSFLRALCAERGLTISRSSFRLPIRHQDINAEERAELALDKAKGLPKRQSSASLGDQAEAKLFELGSDRYLFRTVSGTGAVESVEYDSRALRSLVEKHLLLAAPIREIRAIIEEQVQGYDREALLKRFKELKESGARPGGEASAQVGSFFVSLLSHDLMISPSRKELLSSLEIESCTRRLCGLSEQLGTHDDIARVKSLFREKLVLLSSSKEDTTWYQRRNFRRDIKRLDTGNEESFQQDFSRELELLCTRLVNAQLAERSLVKAELACDFYSRIN